jgi:hypothetical protein
LEHFLGIARRGEIAAAIIGGVTVRAAREEEGQRDGCDQLEIAIHDKLFLGVEER